jgi:hypothetical protein
VLRVASATMNAQGSSATLSVSAVTVHTSTLEARVSLLEEKLKLADQQINDARLKQEEESKNRIEAINSEATARVAQEIQPLGNEYVKINHYYSCLPDSLSGVQSFPRYINYHFIKPCFQMLKTVTQAIGIAYIFPTPPSYSVLDGLGCVCMA